MNYLVDIRENSLLDLSEEVLSILLLDRTTKKNIIWATDNYKRKGNAYGADKQIKIDLITGRHGNVVKPRTAKSKTEQLSRVRSKAEVFTPSWICNAQNNLVDEAWFGRKNVFNIEKDNSWIANIEKIEFSGDKTWQDYVKENRLEISCGEAPYLASRYDTVTGEFIEVEQRIGLLDRKLRVVCENVDSEPDWIEWTISAYKSIYGFDWQGDNVLLARENLLATFIDYYTYKFGLPPITAYLIKIAEILSWNIWQMDGLKGVVPNSCKKVEAFTIDFFGDKVGYEDVCEGCAKDNIHIHNGKYCYIMDWEKGKRIKYISLIKEKIE